MKQDIKQILTTRGYVGRGIIVGENENKNAIVAYFIMGRSQNSQNRIFVKEGNSLIIYPFDPSKVEDPSLIIYSPIRTLGSKVIVTNGDQTDTIYDALSEGETFEVALDKRTFEPDYPNLTPRISAILDFENDLSYKENILKAFDKEEKICMRNTFSFEKSKPGSAHFISTYMGDGTPLPSFEGEPLEIEAKGDCEEFANYLWESLHPEYKVSLFVGEYDKHTMNLKYVIKNKNEK